MSRDPAADPAGFQPVAAAKPEHPQGKHTTGIPIFERAPESQAPGNWLIEHQLAHVILDGGQQRQESKQTDEQRQPEPAPPRGHSCVHGLSLVEAEIRVGTKHGSIKSGGLPAWVPESGSESKPKPLAPAADRDRSRSGNHWTAGSPKN